MVKTIVKRKRKRKRRRKRNELLLKYQVNN